MRPLILSKSPFHLLKDSLWGRKKRANLAARYFIGFMHAGHSSLRLFVALLVLLFFLLLTIQLQPFRQQEDNLVSTLANILLLCAFLGMGAG